MGLFSMCKKLRKSHTPERLKLDIQHLTPLDRFSLEIGSPGSASGWVVPDSILSPTTPTWSSPRGDVGNSSLRLRGGEMQDFEDCDPNSPTSLERYLFWIDQDYYDEQFSLRQDQGNAQLMVQLAEQDLYDGFVSPSVDDLCSDSDSNSNSDSGECGGCLLIPNPSTSSGPHHHLHLEEDNDVAIAASPSIGQWLHHNTFHNRSQCSDVLTIEDDEECEYDADIESVWSINSSVQVGSDLLDLPDYEEFEATQCHCYDSLSHNTAASQPSMPTPLCQEVTEDEEEHTSCDDLLDSSLGGEVSESDSLASSEELQYLISRFHGFSDSIFISESTHNSQQQQQQPPPPFPTAVIHPNLLPIDSIQADSGLLRSGLGFSRETTDFETRDISSCPLLFGQRIVDGFMFTFEHNDPRYPS